MASDNDFQTWIFDCDGVILDSNRIKTEAFRKVAMQFGSEPARRLVDFHVARGGVSRIEKFGYFVSEILNQPQSERLVPELCEEFADTVSRYLANAAVADGLPRLRSLTRHATWLVVSGGVESEIRACFVEKGIDNLFDGGIHGNPATKSQLFASLLKSGSIVQPAVYFGDSEYDFEVATNFDIDFCFIHGWTEMNDWEGFCSMHGLRAYETVEAAARSILGIEA